MSTVITNHQVGEIADPKLRKLLKRVAREMELSIKKVAANHATPNEFPLSSDPNSTERILSARFNSLPQAVKGRAGAKVLSSLNNSVAHNRRFGDLEAVDLKVETPVGVQVRALSLPAQMSISSEEWRLMLQRNGGGGGGGPIVKDGTFYFVANAISGNLNEDWGKDEIYAVVSIGGLGTTTEYNSNNVSGYF